MSSKNQLELLNKMKNLKRKDFDSSSPSLALKRLKNNVATTSTFNNTEMEATNNRKLVNLRVSDLTLKIRNSIRMVSMGNSIKFNLEYFIKILLFGISNEIKNNMYDDAEYRRFISNLQNTILLLKNEDSLSQDEHVSLKSMLLYLLHFIFDKDINYSLSELCTKSGIDENFITSLNFEDSNGKTYNSAFTRYIVMNQWNLINRQTRTGSNFITRNMIIPNFDLENLKNSLDAKFVNYSPTKTLKIIGKPPAIDEQLSDLWSITIFSPALMNVKSNQILKIFSYFEIHMRIKELESENFYIKHCSNLFHNEEVYGNIISLMRSSDVDEMSTFIQKNSKLMSNLFSDEEDSKLKKINFKTSNLYYGPLKLWKEIVIEEEKDDAIVEEYNNNNNDDDNYEDEDDDSLVSKRSSFNDVNDLEDSD